jgi:hypothetical protein
VGYQYGTRGWEASSRTTLVDPNERLPSLVVEVVASDIELVDALQSSAAGQFDIDAFRDIGFIEALTHRTLDGGPEVLRLPTGSDVYYALDVYCDIMAALSSGARGWDREDLRSNLNGALLGELRVPLFGSPPAAWDTLGSLLQAGSPAATAFAVNLWQDGTPLTFLLYYTGFTIALRVIDPVLGAIGDSLKVRIKTWLLRDRSRPR